jgi:hypothetical protein
MRTLIILAVLMFSNVVFAQTKAHKPMPNRNVPTAPAVADPPIAVTTQTQSPEPDALVELRQQHQKKIDAVVRPLAQKYVKDLQSLQETFTKANMLQEALAVQAEVKSAQDELNVDKPVLGSIGKHTLKVRLTVDGTDKLILSRSSLTYQHFESAPATGATVNGKAWSLSSAYDIRPNIPSTRSMTAKKIAGRGRVNIVETKDGVVATIEDPIPYTDVYEVEFTW